MTRPALPRWTRGTVQHLLSLRVRLFAKFSVGVRVMVFDERGYVLLVRHSYLPGWHFPGGGVEPGETVAEAARRELREEAGFECLDQPVLHGLFLNRALANRDHVAVLVVRHARAIADAPDDWEIVEKSFFPPDNLPDEATGATRARLREYLDGVRLSETW